MQENTGVGGGIKMAILGIKLMNNASAYTLAL